NEIDGSGGIEELEWLYGLSLSSSLFSLVLSSRELLCSLGVKFPSHDPIVQNPGHDIKRTVEVNASFFDMHMPNVAWYLKVGGASSYDDRFSKKY
nr:hypothetical protein [Tanacetum cinerariifolium]